MNTASFRLTSWTPPVVAAAALIGVLAVLPANAGENANPNQAPQAIVKYADLDIESDAGALALYRRIASAAHEVCPDNGTRDLRRWQAARECRDQAMARAISQVGSVRLAAIRAARARVG
jgi:UrcA family protein